jgi:hypothetical protein
MLQIGICQRIYAKRMFQNMLVLFFWGYVGFFSKLQDIICVTSVLEECLQMLDAWGFGHL